MPVSPSEMLISTKDSNVSERHLSDFLISVLHSYLHGILDSQHVTQPFSVWHLIHSQVPRAEKTYLFFPSCHSSTSHL
jgi:hypothetical protein